MSLETLRNALPDFARDMKLNLGSLLTDQALSPTQAWGCAVACALAARQPQVLAWLTADARNHLPEPQLQAALAAGTIMGMNNVYYRFNHMMEEGGDAEYASMPARLRMQALARHEADKLDFELWCLAVSAINGCSACVVSHEKACRDKGASKATVQAAVRLGAVVKATADAFAAHLALEAAQG
jgi:alkyl hydroperoxide reductase subunit D